LRCERLSPKRSSIATSLAPAPRLRAATPALPAFRAADLCSELRCRLLVWLDRPVTLLICHCGCSEVRGLPQFAVTAPQNQEGRVVSCARTSPVRRSQSKGLLYSHCGFACALDGVPLDIQRMRGTLGARISRFNLRTILDIILYLDESLSVQTDSRLARIALESCTNASLRKALNMRSLASLSTRECIGATRRGDPLSSSFDSRRHCLNRYNLADR
jgi:hypothetical protein